MATSSFIRFMENANGTLTGYSNYIYIVPSDQVVNTNMPLAEDSIRAGVYYRDGVPDGEYKIYINADKSGELTESDVYKRSDGTIYKIWIGEKAITDHKTRTDNPHSVTKNQVGLGNAENTSDADKPVSTATQIALNTKVDKDTGKSLSTNDFTNELKAAYNGHLNNTSNPHNTTKVQVGLGNADNTSDINKPISTATQTVLDNKASTTALNSHINNTNNPHATTKAQIGLGNADNTSDINKPISTATQTALDNKASMTALNSHINNTNNPHATTKAQVGLGNADNTSDINKPISAAAQTALNSKVDKEDGKGLSTNDFTNELKAAYNGHLNNNSNPHNTTKAQVGLGNVPNLDTTNAIRNLGGENTLDQTLAEWTEGIAYQLLSITRDSNGIITGATIKWPDGSSGVFTSTIIDSSFYAINAYTITHVASGKTITQPGVTRDTLGNIITKPDLTIG
jgi:hypothetical protein